MNKKAFLAGDALVYVYSIIALAIIAVLFTFLFYYLQGESFFSSKTNIAIEEIKPNVASYENLNYYLNTEFRFNGKISSLKDLIPLYCYTNNEELAKYILRISGYLFPSQLGITVGCSTKQESCTNFVTKYGFLDTSKFDKTLILQGSIYSPKIFDIPGLNPPIHYCVQIQNGKHKTDPYKDNFEIEYIPSDKLFEEKVKAAELMSKEIGNRPNPEGSVILLSPTKDLWFFTRADWCNLIEDDCSKYVFFKSEDLMRCKGDYLCLKK